MHRFEGLCKNPLVGTEQGSFAEVRFHDFRLYSLERTSQITQQIKEADEGGEAKERQTGKVLDFSSYRQQRRENEIAIPIKSPDATPDEPIPSRQSPVPDLQPRQTPVLELQSLKFFDSANAVPEQEHRQYATSFPQKTTCYVYTELIMDNRLYLQRSETYALRTQNRHPVP